MPLLFLQVKKKETNNKGIKEKGKIIMEKKEKLSPKLIRISVHSYVRVRKKERKRKSASERERQDKKRERDNVREREKER